MLYAFDRDSTSYSIYDNSTELIFHISEFNIIRMIKSGMQIANFTVKGNKLEHKNWPQKITEVSGYDNYYILIHRYGDDVNKLITNTGKQVCIKDSELYSLIHRRKVINCSEHAEGYKFHDTDTKEYVNEHEFCRYIEREYEKYMCKMKCLNIGTEFMYTINGADVILTFAKYKVKNMVVPNFITVIGDFGLSNLGIETIQLNEGLRIIGNHALESNKIQRIAIPETVKICGTHALRGNKGISNKSLIYNVDKTIIL